MASKVRPPGDEGPPFDFGPPGRGPPPPRGWGPPPPGGWGPPLPGGFGPPPPPERWGAPRPEDWGPPHEGWRHLVHERWGSRSPPLAEWGLPPPEGWGPRGHFPHDWDHRVPPPPGWGRHPEDWPPPPDDWRRFHPDDLMPPPGWRPESPPHHWGPEPLPPLPPPGIPPPGILPPEPAFGPLIPHAGLPPPDPAYGPAIPPPGLPPPMPYPGFPTAWTREPVVEEVMPNPPPDQPEWIKALISAPSSDVAPTESKKPVEETLPIAAPAAEDPTASSTPKTVDKTNVAQPLVLLGKRNIDKPPPGRSIGTISFIGLSFGYIEREDQQKFTFSFTAFFGNPNAMKPGVKVHFTPCKDKDPQQNTLIATDVKVAPHGTERVDTEIYEAVVSQPITEFQSSGRQYPGQVQVNIGSLKTNLDFESRDSTVTLLKNDQVLINLMTDIVTEKRRATNIRPKIPSTFSHTGETREKGIVISLKDTEGVIESNLHGQLPFQVKENFSDVDFTSEDINEEVEFTVATFKSGKQAVRIKRVKEPLLLTFCYTKSTVAEVLGPGNLDQSSLKVLGKTILPTDLGPNMRLDTELYEGIVTQTIIEPTPNLPGYPGQIHANIGPIRTNVTFSHRDCHVTLLKNDHVLINLLYDLASGKRRAANIKPKVPFTFSYTKETREQGNITFLGPEEGIIKSDLHGELPFSTCENFSDTEFSSSDIHNEVEFTVATVDSKKRAIRLLRSKKVQDQILHEQKKREEAEKKRRQEEENRKKNEEVEKQQRFEVEGAAVVQEAAKCKWMPLVFKLRDPDKNDISKERFVGTVLRAINRTTRKTKMEVSDNTGGAEAAPSLPLKAKIKEERLDNEHKEGDQNMAVKEEEEEVMTGPEVEQETGRLVMTVDGVQKQLTFGPYDLLSTATMLDGDKVRFKIATNRETKVERATAVEILPESFEESIEQRRHGIVIEFSNQSGLIKCTQNPQLYFNMCEVLEKKKLELNEKVEFSVVPHETADGGHQAIRIKRFTESVFQSVRKLGGLAANKAKMTIKLTKPNEDSETEKPKAEKLKAVVKNLRTQDKSPSKSESSSTQRRHGRSRSRSPTRSRARSRTPLTDQFGRTAKERRSTSVDRKSSRYRQSRSRSRERSKKRSRSSSKSRSRSRSRSRERRSRRRSKVSKEKDEGYKRRRDISPPSRHVRGMEDELERKKRELQELDEMIAYKKSLVDRDPGQRTSFDYDHGRITVPLAEYKPVRSILKNRPESSEYFHHPPYEDPYYDRAYSPYQERHYEERLADPYRGHPYDRSYADRRYTERPYETRAYAEATYDRPSAGQRYTDRYDVYDEPYEDHRYREQAYSERSYNDSYHPAQRSPSSHGSFAPPQSDVTSGSSIQLPLTQATAASLSQTTFRPPSPAEPPPKSPSPHRPSPPVQKQPLDRFLDMLNKKVDAEKKSESSYASDDLLPHERALQDGKGFSQIVGLAQEKPSSSQRAQMESSQTAEPRSSSAERPSEASKSPMEPYDKIQNLLRTIGLKLSTGDMSKLANRAQEKVYDLKSSSSERQAVASPKESMQSRKMGSFDSDQIHSPGRSSSSEPLGRPKATSEYEDFLDQHEFEALKKAQQQQGLAKAIRSASFTTPSVKPPPGPPPDQYQDPPQSFNLNLAVASQGSSGQSLRILGKDSLEKSRPSQNPPGLPPGPPPGPPPRRPLGAPPGLPPGHPAKPPAGQPNYGSSSQSALLFISPPHTGVQPDSNSCLTTAAPTQSTTSSTPCDKPSVISTTTARCLKVIETVKSLTAQSLTKPVKSVQFTLPAEPSSESSPQSEEDIKNKQKEKLDLYNQRIQEKREQQYKEMLAWKKDKSKDATLVAPGRSMTSEPKNIWICGHSLVYWAESRAKSPEVGVQLGMDPSKVSVWWKGIQGMTWPQLLPQLHQLKITWPNPDVLILHLGGNDLSTDSPTNLLASVKKDLTSMKSIFPNCILVWSSILPRRVWRHSNDSQEVDLVRTTVNRRIQNIVSDLGGASLSHDNIRCGTNTGLYRANGVHLSPKGIDVFNLNLQDFLEKWELSLEKS